MALMYDRDRRSDEVPGVFVALLALALVGMIALVGLIALVATLV